MSFWEFFGSEIEYFLCFVFAIVVVFCFVAFIYSRYDKKKKENKSKTNIKK